MESEVVQAAELLEQWRRLEIPDALKLLGKHVAFRSLWFFILKEVVPLPLWDSSTDSRIVWSVLLLNLELLSRKLRGSSTNKTVRSEISYLFENVACAFPCRRHASWACRANHDGHIHFGVRPRQ